MDATLIDEALVSALYDDALHGGDWRPALQRLRAVTGAADAALSFARPGEVLSHSTDRILNADARRRYVEHYGRLDPKSAIFARRKAGYLFNDAEHFDDGFVARDPFYQEFSRSIDSRHTLDLALVKTAALEAYLACVRSPRQGAFDPRAESAFRQAARHFLLVSRLRDRIAAAQSALRHSAAALDSFHTGLLVLDAGSEVVLANAAALAATAAGEGLVLRHNRLSARAPAVERDLALAIAAVLASGGARVLRVPRPDKRFWALSVLPLPASSALALRERSGVLILLSDPGAARQVRRDDLKALYGLTPAEADLALALGQGRILGDIAARRGVKISTVRTQLLAVLQKMNVRRQSDLVRVLAALPAAHLAT